ncbi:SRPBCC family protein [Angustibacter luteus]|uniref:SRPBCC family protein n=1 Tax=Angustibacter luteus TaxID=658456 RepID=A0ABW1JBL2_9ACTN
MTTTATHETRIEADPKLPTVKVVRDFDHPRDKVFRAWTDPELVARWMGPRNLEMTIEHWDLRTGGSYRYTAWREGERIAGFWGSFHDVREDRIVQTFSFDGAPDGVSLDTLTLEDLGDGRTRTTVLSVVESMEIRDMIMASGMDVGVVEGYEQLDELLAGG